MDKNLNYISKVARFLLQSDTLAEAMEMASKVKVGRMKVSELEILARGGKGISRHRKRVAKMAKRQLGL